MPFTAIHNGDVVWPDDVDGGADIYCPECEDDLHIVRGHTTETGTRKPRHFSHNPGSRVGGLCHGGESNTHKLMKYVVSRRLTRMYEHADVTRETHIPETDRQADVVAEFDHPAPKLGRGVVAEVQYKNKDKDIEQVTKDYLRAGFSVYWLSKKRFGDDFETVEFPDIVTAWPNGVPTHSEWSGVEEHWMQLSKFGSRYEIEAIFPPDFFRSIREQLKNSWYLGYGEYDYDLVYEFTENNAPRRCSVCRDDADYYLFQDSVISTYRCPDHLPGETNESDIA